MTEAQSSEFKVQLRKYLELQAMSLYPLEMSCGRFVLSRQYHCHVHDIVLNMDCAVQNNRGIRVVDFHFHVIVIGKYICSVSVFRTGERAVLVKLNCFSLHLPLADDGDAGLFGAG